MSTILHIASSSNLSTSVTRQIGAEVIKALKIQSPSAAIIERDLAKQPIPHLSPEVVAVFYNPPGTPELALSDQLVEEVLAADILLLEVPMYNFAIPSSLKAWIDHVVRKGRTFNYSAAGPEGLAKNKRAILVLGRGGIYSEGPAKVMDHQESYLRMILAFIGITDVETIYIEGVGMGPEKVAEALAAAKSQASNLFMHSICA